MKVMCIVSDLVARSRVSETLKSLGAEPVTARTEEQFDERYDANDYALIVLDLHVTTLDPNALIARITSGPVRPRIMCFYSHVDRERAEKARVAGADIVVPRSKFSSELSDVLISALSQHNSDAVEE